MTGRKALSRREAESVDGRPEPPSSQEPIAGSIGTPQEHVNGACPFPDTTPSRRSRAALNEAEQIGDSTPLRPPSARLGPCLDADKATRPTGLPSPQRTPTPPVDTATPAR